MMQNHGNPCRDSESLPSPSGVVKLLKREITEAAIFVTGQKRCFQFVLTGLVGIKQFKV